MQRKHIRRQGRRLGALGTVLLLCAAAHPAHPAASGGPPAVVAVALDASGSLSDTEIARARDLAAALLSGLPAGPRVRRVDHFAIVKAGRQACELPQFRP